MMIMLRTEVTNCSEVIPPQFAMFFKLRFFTINWNCCDDLFFLISHLFFLNSFLTFVVDIFLQKNLLLFFLLCLLLVLWRIYYPRKAFSLFLLLFCNCVSTWWFSVFQYLISANYLILFYWSTYCDFRWLSSKCCWFGKNCWRCWFFVHSFREFDIRGAEWTECKDLRSVSFKSLKILVFFAFWVSMGE